MVQITTCVFRAVLWVVSQSRQSMQHGVKAPAGYYCAGFFSIAAAIHDAIPKLTAHAARPRFRALFFQKYSHLYSVLRTAFYLSDALFKVEKFISATGTMLFQISLSFYCVTELIRPNVKRRVMTSKNEHRPPQNL